MRPPLWGRCARLLPRLCSSCDNIRDSIKRIVAHSLATLRTCTKSGARVHEIDPQTTRLRAIDCNRYIDCNTVTRFARALSAKEQNVALAERAVKQGKKGSQRGPEDLKRHGKEVVSRVALEVKNYFLRSLCRVSSRCAFGASRQVLRAPVAHAFGCGELAHAA